LTKMMLAYACVGKNVILRIIFADFIDLAESRLCDGQLWVAKWMGNLVCWNKGI